MKLAYYQSIDPSNPLPKLGRKVEPEYKRNPRLERAFEVWRFEYGASRIDDLDAAISRAVKAAAEHFGSEVFAKAMLDGCTQGEGAGLVGFDSSRFYTGTEVRLKAAEADEIIKSAAERLYESIRQHIKTEEVAPGILHTYASIPQGQHVTLTTNAALDDGWIAWGGGECPTVEKVCVRFRSGIEAGKYSPTEADFIRWDHNGGSFDVIAYRIHKHPEVNSADLLAARERAVLRVGRVEADNAWDAVAAQLGCIGNLYTTPSAWPAAIAALEALK